MIMAILAALLYSLFSASFALYSGDKCTVLTNSESGRCISIDSCDYAKNLLRGRKIPQSCGFASNNSSVPLVCCPAPSGTFSRMMCEQYFRKRFHPVHEVDLGTKASVKEFPHMAAVGFRKTDILWLCGGSLISHHFVLTAAHCVDSLEYGPARWVRLGDLDLVNTTEDADPQDFKITQSYIHPQYKSSSHYHDIALFKLHKTVDFSDYFKPACLHTSKEIPVTKLQATGWGKQGLFGDLSSHLLKVDLNIIDHGVCAARYTSVSNRKLKNGILEKYQICAGDDSGKDTCPGDSGGPLHYWAQPTNQIESHYVVTGITSFGKGCGGGNTVGVYTRVSSYVGWIEDIVWAEGSDNELFD